MIDSLREIRDGIDLSGSRLRAEVSGSCPEQFEEIDNKNTRFLRSDFKMLLLMGGLDIIGNVGIDIAEGLPEGNLWKRPLSNLSETISGIGRIGMVFETACAAMDIRAFSTIEAERRKRVFEQNN